jgi:indolepyruvate ferredoxin oxidoreductase, beta subunit
MSGDPRPIKLLIAALGGEGGAVLTNWIVTAAESLGFAVQSTSIPGVAQRTGATTYYIEIMPASPETLNSRRPVFALVPGIGDVDLVVTSELLEAGRAVGGGFVTPDRTMLIASTHRIFAMAEKIQMGDGRLDAGKLLQGIAEHARASLLLDLDEIARENGAMLNAVMLGAIAGTGGLPIPDEAFAAAIEAEGKAAEANLRGFRAGLEAARRAKIVTIAPVAKQTEPIPSAVDEMADVPEAARAIVAEGVRRLTAYQNQAYARRYLERLKPIAAADRTAGIAGKLLAETARHLAVRMSFEDVIRVAEAKLEPARLQRIAREIGAAPDEPFTVIEFFKPGIEELASLLPSFLARPILRISERRGWLGRVYLGMHVKTTSVSGYLKLRLLASIKPLRPRSHRFREEQRAIESWLGLIGEAAPRSGELALEIAECARLVKGYGDTLKRGAGNYRAIEDRIVRPALDGRMTAGRATDAIASARAAALADPEGEGLARCFAEIEAQDSPSLAAE